MREVAAERKKKGTKIDVSSRPARNPATPGSRPVKQTTKPPKKKEEERRPEEC